MSARGARLLRAENGASLRRRRTEASRMDRDVVAYANKGQTERPNRIGMDRLNRFVRGIKRLGLWTDMICWPIRRSVRSRTGTTAYSLGGWQTADGTLTTTAMAGANGYTSGGQTAQRNMSVTVTGKDSLLSFHCIMAARLSLLIQTQIGQLAFLNPHSFRQTMSTPPNTLLWTDGTAELYNSPNTTDSSIHFIYHFGQDSSTRYFQRDSVRQTSTPGSPVALSGDTLTFAGHPTNSPAETLNGTFSFCAFFKKALSAETVNQINFLLNDTLQRGNVST